MYAIGTRARAEWGLPPPPRVACGVCGRGAADRTTLYVASEEERKKDEEVGAGLENGVLAATRLGGAACAVDGLWRPRSSRGGGRV